MWPIYWIAKHTISKAIRSKTSFVIFLLLLLVLVVLPNHLQSDGSVEGSVKILLMWTMGGTLLLLSVFTLFTMITAIRSDITEKQVLILETTPAHRWKVLLGKFIAVSLINFVLICFVGGISYTNIILKYKALEDKHENAKVILKTEPFDEKALEIKRDYHVLKQDVLSARKSIEDYYNVDEMVDRDVEELLKGGKLEGSEAEFRRKRKAAYSRDEFFFVPARSRSARPIIFKNVPKAPPNVPYFTFSYNLFSSQNMNDRITGIWTVVLKGKYLDSQPKQIAMFKVDHPSGQYRSLRFSSDNIDADSTLFFRFDNYGLKEVLKNRNKTFKVLVPFSTFELNLTKACLLIYFKLILIACLGIFLSSFLSFPVSVFMGSCYIFFSYVHELFSRAIRGLQFIKNKPDSAVQVNYFDNMVTEFSFFIVKIFPDFHDSSGDNLVNGEFITWLTLIDDVGFNVIFRGGFLFLLGMVIYHYVEMGQAVIDD